MTEWFLSRNPGPYPISEVMRICAQFTNVPLGVPPTTKRRSRYLILWQLSFALFLVASIGCAAKAKPEPWVAKSRVGWQQISTLDAPPVSEGYVLLNPKPTKGLFPASLAVSRVGLEAKPLEATEQPGLYTDPRNEFLQWNSAFDDLMAVSEVFPITERTLGGGEADPEQILAAFRALNARLGLVYAVNEMSPTETEMLAVLYDVRAGVPLAFCRTSAASAPPPDSKSEAKKLDPWTTDSRALVRAKFERFAHACLRELTLKDTPSELEDKSGWTSDRPRLPAEWPPRQSAPRP